MAGRYIFHLAFPVADLEASRRFYVDVLGASIGRENAEWLDILLWGHQITLHLRPDEVLPLERQGKRHFGVVLPWAKWQRLVQRIAAGSASFYKNPEVFFEGAEQEQAKFYLKDPGNNIIEIKAYRNFGATLKQNGDRYNYEQT
ncbi:MAG TPA: VOC family protein [Gammaproteobacteria bacterium]